jgi:hypothetical protein
MPFDSCTFNCVVSAAGDRVWYLQGLSYGLGLRLVLYCGDFSGPCMSRLGHLNGNSNPCIAESFSNYGSLPLSLLSPVLGIVMVQNVSLDIRCQGSVRYVRIADVQIDTRGVSIHPTLKI